VIYNETGIDISLIVEYHHKFHHQNKNNSMSSAGVDTFKYLLLNWLRHAVSIFKQSCRPTWLKCNMADAGILN